MTTNERSRTPNGDTEGGYSAESMAFHEAFGFPRIAGYMPVFAPADSDWTDDEVEDYVRRRKRIDLGLLDGLSEAEVETLADHGFPKPELAELRDLTAEHYRRLVGGRQDRPCFDCFDPTKDYRDE